MATIQERVSKLEGAREHTASKTDVSDVKDELKTFVSELKAEMRAMELRITLWLGGLMIGIAGVMTAIIVFEQRFLP